jgi:hypothetical protein
MSCCNSGRNRGCGNRNCGCGNRNLLNELCRCVGEAVTIYTDGGEYVDSGFTGILTGINANCARLTAIPCRPCGGCGGCDGCGECGGCGGCSGCGNQNNRCGNRQTGTSCYIPTRQITAFCPYEA